MLWTKVSRWDGDMYGIKQIAADKIGSGTSDGGFAAIAVTNPDCLDDVVNEDLSIADFSGAGRIRDALDHFLQPRIRNYQIESHFRQKIHIVFLAAVNLFMALLPPVTANFADGHPVDADVLERLFDFFHLEWLDDSFDLFHISFLPAYASIK
jgi:hypothetical protein